MRHGHDSKYTYPHHIITINYWSKRGSSSSLSSRTGDKAFPPAWRTGCPLDHRLQSKQVLTNVLHPMHIDIIYKHNMCCFCMAVACYSCSSFWQLCLSITLIATICFFCHVCCQIESFGVSPTHSQTMRSCTPASVSLAESPAKRRGVKQHRDRIGGPGVV